MNLKRVMPVLLCLVLAGVKTFAQDVITEVKKEKKLKGAFYLTWGYHRDAYSRSTIHFKDQTTDNYDFTFTKAKAKDKPDTENFFRTPLTVPQYVLNVGYFFNDKHNLGIEFSWDHLKYVVIDNQVMHVKGNLRGQYVDQDMLVTPDFVHFEHTNGNNYAMVSLVKRMNLMHGNRFHSLNVLFKGGLGGLVPRTDSSIMGSHDDGPFRLSGFVIGASTNIRYNILQYFYLEAGVKGAFADYTDVKLLNEGRASHHFFSIQYIGAAGINVPLTKLASF
jgi:hypothetical protein